WDGVLEEHLRASFESIVILSIIKKKRTKRKSFLWLFQATVAVFKLPLNNSDTVEIIKKYLSRNKTRHYLRLYLNKLGVLPVLKRFLGNMRM
ncbi:hypothetical protein, partial [Phascolarctobacterium faecium]|uniref:hypothetical protein n=1 Tax=Phascolarctobacterium faecium TaxID=33025 RepID=UPI003AB541FB